jgi:glycosyltransferase involved in cell wall biosynthesis
MADKLTVVLGTRERGGIRAVIEAYEAVGFFTPGRMVRIATHDETGLGKRLALAAAAYAQVLGLLLLRRVALLHLHVSMRGSFWRKALFLFAGRAFGVPVVFHLHGSQFAAFYDGSSPRVQALIRGVLDRADAVVVLSAWWRDYVAPKTRAPVHVIRNFVPEPAAAPGVRRDPARFLFLGQFGARKGIYDLLPVFQQVHAAAPQVHLVCGGNGEVDRVRATVAALGAGDSIEVPGWVAGEEKLKQLAMAGVFVLPSYHEGLPMAIIEALAMGMAVVSTRVGGIPELVVEGENGYLVAAGDRAALGDALLRLAHADPAAIAAMGLRSRRLFDERFSPAGPIAEMRAVYVGLGVTP